MKTNIIVTFLLTAIHVWAQPKQVINYLNQKPPGMVAEIFAPGIVTTDAYEHSSPAFSPDGSVVLWAVIDRGGYLLESTYVNGAWTKPARPSFADTIHNYVYPSFSIDGQKLFFSSDRKVPAGYRQGSGNRIWEVARTVNGWGTPLPFDTTASQSQDYAHSMSKNGTLYFSSGIREGTNWNIRKSEKVNGMYTKPELLPYNINSRDYEDGPYISPDESFLIFESQRPEGTEGNLSLFISFKNKEGDWGMPVNMGPKINSGKGERFARLSPDGKYLFFGSFRNASTTSRGADIYWIDAKVIDELRNSETVKNMIERPLGDELLAALDKKDVNGSADLLERWLHLYPNSLDAVDIYSSILRRQKRYSEAELLLTNPIAEGNGNAEIMIERALVKFGLHDSDGARNLLSPLLEQKMDLRNKFSYLSDELFSMAEYLLSDEYFEQAMAIRSNATAVYNRACAYALINDKTKAFELLNKAIANGLNTRSAFESDPDLTSLQSDERWKLLIKKLK